MINSIIEQVLVTLPLIIGAYLTISLLKLPDFSLESAFLCGAIGAFLAKDLPLVFILLAAIGGGLFVGLVMSFFNQVIKIPYLLAAVITNGLFHGFTQYQLETAAASFRITLPFSEFAFLFGAGVLVLGSARLIIASQLGYSFAIYGNNPAFFLHHRPSGPYTAMCGILLSYGLAGISGFLFAQSNGFVDLTMQIGVVLLCLTSLMLGKLIIRRRSPSILIPLIGSVTYFIAQQTLLRMGLNLKYFNAFQALFILSMLLISRKKASFTLDHLGV